MPQCCKWTVEVNIRKRLLPLLPPTLAHTSALYNAVDPLWPCTLPPQWGVPIHAWAHCTCCRCSVDITLDGAGPVIGANWPAGTWLHKLSHRLPIDATRKLCAAQATGRDAASYHCMQKSLAACSCKHRCEKVKHLNQTPDEAKAQYLNMSKGHSRNLAPAGCGQGPALPRLSLPKPATIIAPATSAALAGIGCAASIALYIPTGCSWW